MGLFIARVLSAAVSLRGASRVLELWSTVCELPEAAPAWYTGRLWLLRVGYYKLTRLKAQAADWGWIIDHTIQLGVPKGLMILGVRLSALPPPGTCLRHEDVEPIARDPVETSTGDVVYQQLTAAVAHTGVPREILSAGAYLYPHLVYLARPERVATGARAFTIKSRTYGYRSRHAQRGDRVRAQDSCRKNRRAV